jgi:2-hydroxy-6-oxonona-2,4-dienedioate hydrolase
MGHAERLGPVPASCRDRPFGAPKDAAHQGQADGLIRQQLTRFLRVTIILARIGAPVKRPEERASECRVAGLTTARHPGIMAGMAAQRMAVQIGVEWARVDGRQVRYRSLSADPSAQGVPGAPRPMLLLHGLAGASDNWVPFLHQLAGRDDTSRVVVPDLPGCGRSAGPRKALGMIDLADWLGRFMDTLELPCADVVAHSMGCQVALALAHRHPDRLGRLVVISPTTGRQHGSPWRVFLSLLRDSPREPFRYKPLALRMFLQMGPRRYLATLAHMWADDGFLRAPEISAPCQVLRGQHDPVVPEAVARRLAEQLPNGCYAHVEEAWHVAHFARPAETARVVLSFLTARFEGP